MVERINEFIQLRKSAMDILNDTTSPNEYLHLVVFTSVYPSFDNLFSWSIFADVDEKAFTARRVYWDYKFDSKRFGNPFAGLKYGWDTIPTFQSMLFAPNTPAICQFLREARNITIGQQSSNNWIALDGTSRTLYVKDAFGGLTHEWNFELDEYKPMIEWTNRLITYLAGYLRANSE